MRDWRPAAFSQIASPLPDHSTGWRRLEALVDGASTLEPVTGSINEDGRIRSDPLVLSLDAPFGGAMIQWSVVFLDEDGHQVGTGVSGKYPNDDPNTPAQKIDIAITELQAAIDAQTSFERADTIAHTEPGASGAGYTWSNQVDVPDTVTSSAIQEPTGIAVSTLAGVVAATWKQQDKYYLRSIGLAENGQTIPWPELQAKGWARRPFVLLDPFVQATDEGNHYLLEPDATADTYQVRKLALDPATSGLSWDESLSYGTLLLPPTAAALHSSGRIVTVYEDSGRLAILAPTPTSTNGRPILAVYRAGPGTQVGLLQSPKAVAVTNPGIILVLEGGANQLAAFDLQGDPAPYFPNQQYRLALTTGRTYLDLPVDGAAHLYLLSYGSGGTSPEDYQLDVLNPDGSPLTSLSTGLNIAHLAVDYWRSVYGLNYAALSVEDTTQPYVDPALNVQEPSISRFDPHNPHNS